MGLLLLLVLLQLIGRLYQQGLVTGDLILRVLDLPLSDGDLLVQQGPALDGVVLVVFQLGELVLDVRLLPRQSLLVVFQLVNVLLAHRLGGGDQPLPRHGDRCQGQQEQRRQQGGRQLRGCLSHKIFSIHSKTQFYAACQKSGCATFSRYTPPKK